MTNSLFAAVQNAVRKRGSGVVPPSMMGPSDKENESDYNDDDDDNIPTKLFDPELDLKDADTRLVALYKLWQFKCRRNKWSQILPPAWSFDKSILKEIGMCGWTHLIDVSPENPDAFMPLRFAKKIYVHPCASKITEPIGSISDRTYADIVRHNYYTAKVTTRPVLQRIVGRINYRPTNYQRLILPLSTSGFRADKLLVGIAYSN